MIPVLQTDTSHHHRLIGGVTSAGDTVMASAHHPVIGGEVKGETSRKVCAFGADFQIIRPMS